MRVIIWTLATDTKMGTETHAFATEQECDDFLFEWACEGVYDDDDLERARAEYKAGELDLHEFVQEHTDYLDTFSADYVIIHIPLWRIVWDTLEEVRWEFRRSLRQLRSKWRKA